MTFVELLKLIKENIHLAIVIPEKIVKNGPATIVFWSDGTKTVVKRAIGERDDDYAAFCAALAKKVYGSNSAVKKVLNNVETIYQK